LSSSKTQRKGRNGDDGGHEARACGAPSDTGGTATDARTSCSSACS
jgi:hypothetical protein